MWLLIINFALHAALEDYIGFSVPLSFESGELVTTITVSIEDDSVWEPDEIFYGRLVNTGIASVNIPKDTATVTILDDDSMLNNGCLTVHHQF